MSSLSRRIASGLIGFAPGDRVMIKDKTEFHCGLKKGDAGTVWGYGVHPYWGAVEANSVWVTWDKEATAKYCNGVFCQPESRLKLIEQKRKKSLDNR